jgi:hypothetical protein
MRELRSSITDSLCSDLGQKRRDNRGGQTMMRAEQLNNEVRNNRKSKHITYWRVIAITKEPGSTGSELCFFARAL